MGITIFMPGTLVPVKFGDITVYVPLDDATRVRILSQYPNPSPGEKVDNAELVARNIRRDLEFLRASIRKVEGWDAEDALTGEKIELDFSEGHLTPESVDMLSRGIGGTQRSVLAAAIVSDGYNNPDLALEIDRSKITRAVNPT